MPDRYCPKERPAALEGRRTLFPPKRDRRHDLDHHRARESERGHALSWSVRSSLVPPCRIRRGSIHRRPPSVSLTIIRDLTGQPSTAQHILRYEMVPPTSTAYLNDKYLKLTQSHGQHPKFDNLPGLACGLFQFIPIDVMHVGHMLNTADRAQLLGRLTVEFRSAAQVWRCVAHLTGSDHSGVDLAQQRTPTKPEVDDLALGTHGAEPTRSRRERRYASHCVCVTLCDTRSRPDQNRTDTGVHPNGADPVSN